MGWFEPTELGERLMPALTSLGAYHDAISREIAERSLPSGEPIDAGERKALARAALDYKVTPEAAVALGNLELELHDADGNVIPTGSIALQDTEYLVALAGDDDDDVAGAEVDVEDLDMDERAEFNAALVELGIDEDIDLSNDADDFEFVDDGDRDWEAEESASTLPRYQIFVDLVDGKSIPVADRWKDDPYVQSLVAGIDPFADDSDE